MVYAPETVRLSTLRSAITIGEGADEIRDTNLPSKSTLHATPPLSESGADHAGGSRLATAILLESLAFEFLDR